MKNEYDFPGAERGKVLRENAEFDLPIYLDADVREYLTERARDKGVEVGAVVNQLLKRDIELIETPNSTLSRWTMTSAQGAWISCPTHRSSACSINSQQV